MKLHGLMEMIIQHDFECIEVVKTVVDFLVGVRKVFPHKRERETQSVGIESVNLVMILKVVMVGCGYDGFLYRVVHGCLCR